MAKKIIMGYWNCVCGETKIPGNVTICPNEFCKLPHDPVLRPTTDWYFPDDAPEVTDTKQIEYAYSGQTWNCGTCDELNPGNVTVCINPNCKEPLGINDTRNRRIVFDDQAPATNRPDPRDEMNDDTLSRAYRVIEQGPDQERVLPNITLPRSADYKSAKDTEWYLADDYATEVQRDKEEQIKNLSPIGRAIYLHRRGFVVSSFVVGTVVLLAVIVVGINYLLATRDGTVTVNSLRWERSIAIERYQTVTREDWTVPPGGRLIYTGSRKSGEHREHDHWEDQETTSYSNIPTSATRSYDCSTEINLGNGHKERNEKTCKTVEPSTYRSPVVGTTKVEVFRVVDDYSPWYTYQIDVWQLDRQARSSGDKSEPMQWPELKGVATNSIPGDQLGEERTGGRNEVYVIEFTDENGVRRSERGQTDNAWQRLQVGDTVKTQYRVHGGDFVKVEWESVTQSTS